MRRLQRVAVVAAIAGMGLAAGASAQGESPWLIGLETRVGPTDPHLTRDYELGVIPSVSYFVSQRVRVDGFLGFAYADGDNYALWAMPGFRYYHRTAPARLRWNSGLSAGFKLLDEQSPELILGEPDDVAILRLVPIELEYWRGGRGAFTVGLDYQARLLEGGSLDEQGLGLTAGFRVRLR